MLILFALGSGLIWYGRRTTAAQLTDAERGMRTFRMWRSLFSGGPERALPVLGGIALQFAGLIILVSAFL